MCITEIGRDFINYHIKNGTTHKIFNQDRNKIKMDDSNVREEIIFRGRSKETGEWVEGNYHHNIRKGSWHGVSPKETNEMTEIYRESLQIKSFNGWEDI